MTEQAKHCWSYEGALLFLLSTTFARADHGGLWLCGSDPRGCSARAPCSTLRLR